MMRIGIQNDPIAAYKLLHVNLEQQYLKNAISLHIKWTLYHSCFAKHSRNAVKLACQVCPGCVVRLETFTKKFNALNLQEVLFSLLLSSCGTVSEHIGKARWIKQVALLMQ